MKSKPKFLTDIEKEIKNGLKEKELSSERRITIFSSGIKIQIIQIYKKKHLTIKLISVYITAQRQYTAVQKMRTLLK